MKLYCSTILLSLFFLTGCAHFINLGPQRVAKEEWKYPEFGYRTLTRIKGEEEWQVYNYVSDLHEVNLFQDWQEDLFTSCDLAYEKRPKNL